MSIFNITDVTTAGAFCNAMKAASESDHRSRRYQEAKSETQEAVLAHRTHTFGYAIRALRFGLDALHLDSFGSSKSA